jgi:hypothetical protein
MIMIVNCVLEQRFPGTAGSAIGTALAEASPVPLARMAARPLGEALVATNKQQINRTPLERLQIDPRYWLYMAEHFESRFKGLVGAAYTSWPPARHWGIGEHLALRHAVTC